MNSFGKPITAGPRDYVVGYTEWGAPIYQTPQGQQYYSGLLDDPKPQHPAMDERGNLDGNAPWREDIGTPVNALKQVAQAILGGMWQGVEAPANALRGEQQTLADPWATALDWGLLTAPASAPANSLRAGGLLSEPETMAQKIARMLRDGDAANVTDDMMAAADDMELWRLYEGGATGQAMPMDETARIARAADSGFMEMPVYHGTANDFPAFEPAKRGATMDNPMSRQADVWVARDPEMAGEFANAAARQRGELPLRGQQTLPLVHRADQPGSMGDVSQVDLLDGLEALNRAFYKDGFDTAYMKNYTSPGGKTGDILALRDAAKVRSRFARFDPRLKHLANLSAGGAGAAIMNALTDDERDEIRNYLRGL